MCGTVESKPRVGLTLDKCDEVVTLECVPQCASHGHLAPMFFESSSQVSGANQLFFQRLDRMTQCGDSSLDGRSLVLKFPLALVQLRSLVPTRRRLFEIGEFGG